MHRAAPESFGFAQTRARWKQGGWRRRLVGRRECHVGDGNFHETIPFEEKQREMVEACVDKMVTRALDMDGTCTVS